MQGIPLLPANSFFFFFKSWLPPLALVLAGN